MTAFNLRLPDAQFQTSLRGLRLPNRRKLVAEFVLGGTQADSIKNRADPSKPLTVVGTPVYNANSVTVKSDPTIGNGFWLDPSLLPNDDATLICVRKPQLAVTTMFIVGMDSPQWIGFRAFNANFASNGEPATNQGAQRPLPAAGTIFFEALVLSRKNLQRLTGGLGKLYWYAGGVQQVATSPNQNTNARAGYDGKRMAIGGTTLTASANTNSCEVLMFGMYQRSLSTAEIDEAYVNVVADYATRGVTVV
jgi:hypothetical protein